MCGNDVDTCVESQDTGQQVRKIFHVIFNLIIMMMMMLFCHVTVSIQIRAIIMTTLGIEVRNCNDQIRGGKFNIENEDR